MFRCLLHFCVSMSISDAVIICQTRVFVFQIYSLEFCLINFKQLFLYFSSISRIWLINYSNFVEQIIDMI